MQSQALNPLDHSALHLLHRASQAADELFARDCPNRDLTPRQYAVLVVLETQQSASQTEIVEATGIDRSTLADIVKRLVRRGLLSRRRSRTDARAYAVKLTEAGQTLLAEVKPRARAVDEQLLAGLSGPARRELVDALATMAATLRPATMRKAA